MKKTLGLLLALSIALSPIAAKGGTIDNGTLNQKQELNIQQNNDNISKSYKTESLPSNEENFVKSLAKSMGVTYEEAKQINDKNTTDTILRIGEFTTIYRQQQQSFFINSDVSLVMAVEVKYVHNNFTEVNQISSVGQPYMGVSASTGGTLYRWSGGGFNTEFNANYLRISTSGEATIEISNDYSVGFDVAGLSVSGSTSTGRLYTTGIKTHALYILSSDLR